MTINREPAEIRVPWERRREQRLVGRRQSDTAVASRLNLQVLDEAFADLEATTLHRDEPQGHNFGNEMISPHHGVVQQLASQLRVLDAQRQHLAQLLQDLQTAPWAEF